MKAVLVFSSMFLLISCGNNQTKELPSREAPDTSLYMRVGDKAATTDSLIHQYLVVSENKLRSYPGSDQNVQLKSIFDRKEKTDTAEYLVYRIGYDVKADDGNSMKFETDAWIYINPSTSELYEYDVVNERLVDPFAPQTNQ